MDTLAGERNPHRRVIARLLPITDIAIDPCAGQARRQRPAQKEVIDAKAAWRSNALRRYFQNV